MGLTHGLFCTVRKGLHIFKGYLHAAAEAFTALQGYAPCAPCFRSGDPHQDQGPVTPGTTQACTEAGGRGR